jgi:hypothetical protein
VDQYAAEFLKTPGRPALAAAGARSSTSLKARPALGRSRGGLTPKAHTSADALGRPLRFIISAGQTGAALLADSHAFRALIATMHAEAVISSNRRRKQHVEFGIISGPVVDDLDRGTYAIDMPGDALVRERRLRRYDIGRHANLNLEIEADLAIIGRCQAGAGAAHTIGWSTPHMISIRFDVRADLVANRCVTTGNGASSTRQRCDASSVDDEVR